MAVNFSLTQVSAIKVRQFSAIKDVADEVSWCCVFVLITLLLLNCCEESNSRLTTEDDGDGVGDGDGGGVVRMRQGLGERPCEEIYVVGEGETLHSISDKCGDPFIVEQNPHIHDPDDVFPGLVIKITPMKI